MNFFLLAFALSPGAAFKTLKENEDTKSKTRQ